MSGWGLWAEKNKRDTIQRSSNETDLDFGKGARARYPSP